MDTASTHLRRTALAVRSMVVAVVIVVTSAATVIASTGGPFFGANPPTQPHPVTAEYPFTLQTYRVNAFAESADQIDLLEWALGVYADAGIELPHVDVFMHETPSGCLHPNYGRTVRGFATWPNGSALLYHCGDEFTMLHELAHIADRHLLTADDRDRFLAMRDVEEWQVASSAIESGEEHFANSIAWGLGENYRRGFATPPDDDASMQIAFEAAMEALSS